MKYATIKNLQEALKIRRYRDADEEGHRFETLLNSSGPFRLEFLRWVFVSYRGFVDTRKKAGIYFFQENPDELLKIIQELIHSEDPDDRDTASEVLQEIKIPQAHELLKTLLNDQYPYIQIDVCEFLWEKYPIDVEKTLISLSNHELEYIRKAADNLLQWLSESKK